MNTCADSIRVMRPLFQAGEGGSIPTSALRARHLKFYRCDSSIAVQLCRAWHSRLPNTQDGPWQFAFVAEYHGLAYGAALWNTPSGRCLPQHWIELRRMVVSNDAPKFSASRFLGWMVRYFKAKCPGRERCISYQDTAAHDGTMYLAAGWSRGCISKPRVRDRSGNRKGTRRKYRWNINGAEADASAKVRWEKEL